MDSSLEGAGADPSKCSKMGIDEKRQLVYELSKQSHLASELLQTWSRQEILQILCAEMGKERKYTGLTKVKIIETLLKIVSEKKSGEDERKRDSSPSQRHSKRQRKVDNPSRVVLNTAGENAIHCKNSACRAVLRQEDKFCRRCSCCICHKYDDNKDPSLWLACSSDPPFSDDSCGLSCHLECSFKNERSGLGKDKRNTALDGCFYCVSCGKANDLLECWKKQLSIAKETRRVDVLCYRLFLGQKLLRGVKKYQKLYQIVAEAVKNLEEEVGPLTGHPMKMGRGIVNRLHSGPEVQRLCSSALESLEKIQSDVALYSSHGSKTQATKGSTKIRFEDIRANSLTVVLGANDSSSSPSSPANIIHYSIWHRKVTEKEYPKNSTCTLFTPNTRFVVSGLAPTSGYCFKVVTFTGTRELHAEEISISTQTAEKEAVNCSSVVERSESPLTNCSSLSTPSSVEAESNNDYISYCKKTEEKNVIVPKNLPNNGDSPPPTEDNTARRVSMEPVSDVIQIERKNSCEEHMELKEVVPDNRSGIPVPVAPDLVRYLNASETSLPITPFRSDQIKNKNRNGRTGKSKGGNFPATIENASMSKRKGDAMNGEHSENGGSDSGFEQCVKVIRQLECSGHIEKSFRQKFLTWYSLRARPQEIRVLKIFVDTFKGDPSALAEQIVDTFSDRVSSKRSASGGSSAVVPSGFCMKLWH
ncbi:PREDICTED: VIN3-like protein 2 isoform X3 [Tarenaya hassleriana]|uniref:VIN3-like protein 2 isoform X3 n=1 Tax=Tarenaya hassleriana TaxID=28532 RepID=UPI00053C2CB7|nr:PREDICTED: VIN3-like protein 2 isoform X3 [Tarenaya hassleriana]